MCDGCHFRKEWEKEGRPKVILERPKTKLQKSSPSVPLAVMMSCAHLGEPTGEEDVACLEGCQGQRLKVFHCSQFGRCTIAKKGEGVPASCKVQQLGQCAKYTAKTSLQGTQHAALPLPPISVGVSIGCYKWPSLVELQIKTIRDSCGPVPILVCNDDRSTDAEVWAICERYPDVEPIETGRLSPMDRFVPRAGHVSGDLGAVWQGLHWATYRQLQVLAKLSQRFIFTSKNWLQDGARELLDSGLGMATRQSVGQYGRGLRSEAMLFKVNAWASNCLAMRKLMPQTRTAPDTAEVIIQAAYQDHIAYLYWPWKALAERREEKVEGQHWHHVGYPKENLEEYQRLAMKYGVSLEPTFTSEGWDVAEQRNYKR